MQLVILPKLCGREHEAVLSVFQALDNKASVKLPSHCGSGELTNCIIGFISPALWYNCEYLLYAENLLLTRCITPLCRFNLS